MYCSTEFRKVFRRIHSRYTLGLSATPDIREYKLDIIHQSWLGPILEAESLPGYNIEQDSFKSTAKLIEYYALYAHCKFSIHDNGIIDYSSIVESIVNDPHRNTLIIDSIVELMEKGLFVFVFSDRRFHLEHLYEKLEDRCNQNKTAATLELPEASKKVILYGGSSEETIDKTKRISTVIFTTYAYFSTGFGVSHTATK
ncbi:Superfamily II DNA/RNA [Phytophthora nicotianae]|uniref:Superfamily II DNA/RNA n=1 Tax=Phytophthora nicotianae TaxID=4792 RepID=A0A0W8C1T6_PHYNI|nr:Superfamily II DNA/RNA [Phytophthora nicotianae]KUF85211.1 Superfamily II DNA/RNA [Phytophthora nicotianae]